MDALSIIQTLFIPGYDLTLLLFSAHFFRQLANNFWWSIPFVMNVSNIPSIFMKQSNDTLGFWINSVQTTSFFPFTANPRLQHISLLSNKILLIKTRLLSNQFIL